MVGWRICTLKSHNWVFFHGRSTNPAIPTGGHWSAQWQKTGHWADSSGDLRDLTVTALNENKLNKPWFAGWSTDSGLDQRLFPPRNKGTQARMTVLSPPPHIHSLITFAHVSPAGYIAHWINNIASSNKQQSSWPHLIDLPWQQSAGWGDSDL